MRQPQVSIAPLILSLALGGAACQIDSGEFGDTGGAGEPQVSSTAQASIGGVPARGQGYYEAVAAITILLPSGSDGTARSEHFYCTGVLIEERTVMTAAGCLTGNLEAELDSAQTGSFLDAASVFVQFGASISGTTKYELDSTFNEDPMTVKGLTMHRYYDSKQRGQNDIALLRLRVSPGITPAVIHSEALPQSLVGQPLELVGFGKDDGASQPVEAFTARRVISPNIVTIASGRVTAGTTDLTTCYADGGGPGFMDFGNGPEVVTVTVAQGKCNDKINRQRVDIHATHFLLPFVKYVSGQCDGGGCDVCDYNGTCEENCSTRDWDCPIGAFAGKACTESGQCEQSGACVKATDDDTFLYCDKPCSADDAASCPPSMSCNANTSRCVYEGISPGSQGAQCNIADDCRSGFCENSLCAFECNASDANACQADLGFFCLPAQTNESVTVCRTETRTGGGGFCHVGAHSHATSTTERNSLLAGLGLLMLFGYLRRTRVRRSRVRKGRGRF